MNSAPGHQDGVPGTDPAGAMVEILLIFCRFPEPGRTKTRLIPAVGPEGAARIYQEMAERVVQQVRCVDRTNFRPLLCVEPPERQNEVKAWLGREFDTLPQAPGHLGAKLESAFRAAFFLGAERVVAIGTDCIELTSAHISRSFKVLKEENVVLGPARDGGYYLIGMNRMIPGLFQGITWGTNEVLKETMVRVERAFLLPELGDIDTPEDLQFASRS